MASRREMLFLHLFRYCWCVHGQAPQSQALSQRLAWGFYQVAGLTIRGEAPVDAVVPIAMKQWMYVR